MNRINRKMEYALMALKYISHRYAGQLVTVKEICESTGIPFDATSRVMQLMVQKKILKSEHGAHGGYMLVKDLSKVSFYEVMEAIHGPLEVVRCVSGSGECEFFAGCNIKSPLINFNEKLVDFYKSLSVGSLFQAKEVKKEVFL